MRLLAKFTLIFVLVFGAGLAVAGFVSYRFLQENARRQVLKQAELMMEAMLSARHYTTEQIGPLLEKVQDNETLFLPQRVPAYSATENFNYLRKQYPEYDYKEATLNPTNLRDRAVDWEADVIRTFRDRPDRQQVIGERDTPTGRSLFLARPIQAREPCLECHDVPKAAPAAMIRRYGTANGFGWKPDEIVGAQIVSVPMSVPIQLANDGFKALLVYLAAIFVVSLLVLNLVLAFTVTRPVARLSAMADQISTGNLDVPELPADGKDEISKLAKSFNRMHRSLARAMKLIEEQG